MSVPKKTWGELKVAVGDLRHQLSGLYAMVPSNITFRSLPNGRTRIYFLPNHMNGSEVPLLFTDVSASDSTSSSSSRRLQLNQLLESNFPSTTSGLKQPSREELLMWERKRQSPSWGITSYELHSTTGKLIFPAASNLFQCLDTGFSNGRLFPTEIRINLIGAKLNPQICPSNSDLVAFINNQDIYVAHTVTGDTQRLTFAHKNTGSIVDDPLSAGIPSYVIQEEFCRYQGFWWQPTTNDDVYRIAYEEVDESEVKIYGFPTYLHNNGDIEEFRFPRAGTPNAKSTLKLLEFKVSSTCQIIDVRELEMITPLSILFPWMEYLVRVGWTPESDFIWVQLLDRKQQHLELVLISAQYFVEVSSPAVSPASFTLSPQSPSYLSNSNSPPINHLNYVKKKPLVHTLCSQESDLWINVNNLLHFFPKTKPNEVKFICVNEDTGFRHLYLYTVPLLGVANGIEEAFEATTGQVPSNGSQIPLTSGDWEVLGQQLWVDSENDLVFFLGLRENPLEKHLYVVSLRQPGEIRLLTQPGYSYNVDFSEDCKLVVMSYSNIQKLPVCEVLRLTIHDNNTVDGIHLAPVGYLMEPRMPEGEFYCPELYTHQINAGTNLYAMVFKPHNFEPGRKYPTVLHIYGGPEVQVVSNTFKGMRQLRLHMLAAQGYCVVAIDSRGSRHRGLAFEGHLRCKMGTVELADQVEVLQWLADTLEFIDMKRVGIMGWSYGGYLSLMALAHYPHIFKVSVAGAPVTNWSLYDTGYTERYMDLPEYNQQGYKKGSVLTYVNQFPDEENRLLIIHGLIDENVHFLHTSQLINLLVKAGKPYQLQVYPNERHSLRHMDASKHYETVLLSFLQNNL
ncbi:dipeptidyl peptidase 9 [Frankliniella occidentalis]|uniref:Dipeptidyl peptidase 9 n=2 Tax=Frankliniella occidentalis TaxID=133901 RepID=A0A9C6XCX5_FRAOC|nr:dipeptidyl peptidase 9-like [Frankliniella occidentalis]XP_052132506.1 dipeptidyl peptidase 9-like [Frankliniella occidentalis]XP_052132864.1 dipeptidyl peptidase 9 [Frankliniella occidentalis]